MTSKRVAVIGAGPSGLVVVKELLERGHRPVCFERANGLGGVFRFDEQDGVVWESCRLTSSGLLTAFSDFPVSPGGEEHMTLTEYIGYLNDYCDAFGVSRHIRYGVTVSKVSRNDEEGWEVQITDEKGLSSETFDSVAVCSGLHQHPHIPGFTGQETFTVPVMHASEYRRTSQVEGKKVLIVGAGESGADIAAEVACSAAETVLSIRRGVAVVSRCVYGKPRDYLTSRLANGASHWLYQTRNPADNRKRSVYRFACLPVVVLDKLMQIFQQLFWDNLPLLFPPRAEEIRAKFRARKIARKLLSESGGTQMEQFGTKDDAFVKALAAGRMRRVPAIRSFDHQKVVFEDGSSFHPELVLLCTGFETRMPFIDDSIACADRFLNTFSPETGGSMGFIGFVRPGFGAIPPLAELQARWFALVQSGEALLPSREEMTESIREWTELRRHVFRAIPDRLEHLVDFTVFCDALADQVGCKPGSENLSRESLKWRLKFYAGPFVAAQYRLTGPGAKPELARNVILKLPLAHPAPELVNMYLRWQTCRMLCRFLGAEYAPKLTIQQDRNQA